MQIKAQMARGVGVHGNLRDCPTAIEASMRCLKVALAKFGRTCQASWPTTIVSSKNWSLSLIKMQAICLSLSEAQVTTSVGGVQLISHFLGAPSCWRDAGPQPS